MSTGWPSIDHHWLIAKTPGRKKRNTEITAERAAIAGEIGRLARKAHAKTISSAENEELIRLRQLHQALGRTLNAANRSAPEFDPSSLSRWSRVAVAYATVGK